MSEKPGERERVAALRGLEVLDTRPERDFDLVTDLAAQLFQVPIALLSLVDAERQWFKSRHGLAVCETGRDIAFCAHAIEQEGVFEIPDATADPRFSGNMLVTGDPNIRYYAGSPLTLSSGERVGTLCIIDTKARVPLAPEQRDLLARLAELATVQLELRRLRRVGSMSAAFAGATPDAIVAADADGFITEWNAAAERMFGHSRAEALDAPLNIIMPAELRAAHDAGFRRLIAGGDPKLVGKTVEVPAERRCGDRFPVELSLAAWRDREGSIVGVGGIIRDISQKKALEAEKEKTQRFLDAVLEQLPAMLFVKDATTGKYLLWNTASEETTGLARSDVIGRTDVELFADRGHEFMKRDELALRTGITQTFESSFEREDGGSRTLRTRRIVVPDETGAPLYLVGMSEDVTDWRRAQDRLLFLAGHDPLTGLKNRASFLEELSAALGGRSELAVVLANIDCFKSVNEAYGQHVGDLLLQRFGETLKEAASASGNSAAARLSADEFAILVTGAGAQNRAAQLADMFLANLQAPLDLDGVRLAVSASIGIAGASSGETLAEDLMAEADVALRRAKSEGRGRYRFFDPAMDQAARTMRELEAKLAAALEEGLIHCHFQPLASLETGRIVAFEALARWTDPELGEIGPDVFIPVAEESGLICKLGSKVLRLAVAEAARWTPPLGVAVNLSPAQVEDPGFCEEVASLLGEFDFPAARLELEVTENVMIRDAEAALATLRKLKALGISIAMDDFGTGYSSLGYFRVFPFDKVKIDQSFIREMGSSREALAIVQAVIGLARGLGLSVVAEGVENVEQFDMLLGEGCTQVQGYLLGRPAPIETFVGAVLQDRSNGLIIPGARIGDLSRAAERLVG